MHLRGRQRYTPFLKPDARFRARLPAREYGVGSGDETTKRATGKVRPACEIVAYCRQNHTAPSKASGRCKSSLDPRPFWPRGQKGRLM